MEADGAVSARLLLVRLAEGARAKCAPSKAQGGIRAETARARVQVEPGADARMVRMILGLVLR